MGQNLVKGSEPDTQEPHIFPLNRPNPQPAQKHKGEELCEEALFEKQSERILRKRPRLNYKET